MNNKLEYFEEPMLLFGNSFKTDDPKDGLTIFGPYEQLGKGYEIQAGVIGTQKGIELYKQFIEKLQKPILSPKNSRPTFPGFEAIFGIKWPCEPTITRIIDDDQLSEAYAVKGLKEKTYRLVNLYLDEIVRVQNEEDAKIDIWFIVVPKRIWLSCRPQSADRGMIVDTKSLKLYQDGQMSFLQELNDYYETLNKILNSDSDFHDQLKARLLQEKVSIPVQLFLEPTLEFKNKYRGLKYKPEMCAHLAWTQATTVYYKLSKLPWKLADIRKGVCYVGLVFKKYDKVNQKGFACSAAQMFLDSGDGTVFRGNIGPWASKSPTEFHLSKDAAKELLGLALQAYIDKRKETPKEMFIHGRANFDSEEWEGFQDITNELSPTTQLVGVVIKESDKVKIFRANEEKIKEYGNLRGLGLVIDEYDSFLWTRGFIPRLNTSSSLEIPNPLRVTINKGEADIRQVLQDIMGLTKLNYNACIYGDGLPVTLRFSDLIGDILTAVDSIDSKVLPFKFYI